MAVDPAELAPAEQVLHFEARPRSITAAARRIDPNSKEDLAWVPKKGEKWQEEAWAYVDAVPELKFAAGFAGHALSRLRIYPAVIVDPDQPPVAIQDAVGENGITAKLAADALDETSRLEESEGGIPGLMDSFGTILSVSGDSWAVATPETPTDDETWQVYSESAITKTSKGLARREKPNAKPEEFPPGSFAARIWRRHKRWPALADSNMRAVLSESEELLIYSRQFRAVGKSRNNAGILFLSNKLDLPPPVMGADGKPVPNQMTTLEAGIMASMITPTHDDGSASAVVPHLVRGDGDPEKLIKHFALDRKIDEQAIARVTFLIQRLAHGLDLPVEVLTGIADINHWGSWQIEDQSYKMHLQPLAQVPAAGLAKAFLRPALLTRGNDEIAVRKIVYAIDAASLVVRPNRAADAKDAFDRLAISWDSFRDYLGFDEGDKPTDQELAQRALMGLGDFHRSGLAAPGEAVPGLPSGGGDATSGGDGEMRRQLARALGLVPDTPLAITATARDTSPRVVDLGAQLAEIDTRLREKLRISASAAMKSALTVAGNRLKSRVQGNQVLAKLVKGRTGEEVFAVLGQDRVITASGGDIDGLMAGSFDEVGHDFQMWTAAAQHRTARLLRRYAPDEQRGDEAVARYQRNQDDNRAAAASMLVAGLVTLGSSRLFTPDATPDLGEVDALSVPAGLIREAMAYAGGSSAPTRSPVDDPDSTDVGTVGGVALGADSLAAMGTIDVEVDHWVWVHGDPDRPFEPHEALDGTEFDGFDDETLANNEPWPDFTSFFPGDHDGCTCWAVAVTVSGAETTTIEGD
jgi:hypothetical protein